MPPQIDAVGAVIVHDGLVLCAQRGGRGVLAGMWEFPGGKVEPNELPEAALEREISEELGCVIEVGAQVERTLHVYDFGAVCLTTFWCRLVRGTPQPTEHAAIAWLPAEELSDLRWAPADLPALACVQLQLRS